MTYLVAPYEEDFTKATIQDVVDYVRNLSCIGLDLETSPLPNHMGVTYKK